jgi:hypothetical protein
LALGSLSITKLDAAKNPAVTESAPNISKEKSIYR